MKIDLSKKKAELLKDILSTGPSNTQTPTPPGPGGRPWAHLLITDGTAGEAEDDPLVAPYTATIQHYDSDTSSWISYDTDAIVYETNEQLLSVGTRYPGERSGISEDGEWTYQVYKGSGTGGTGDEISVTYLTDVSVTSASLTNVQCDEDGKFSGADIEIVLEKTYQTIIVVGTIEEDEEEE